MKILLLASAIFLFTGWNFLKSLAGAGKVKTYNAISNGRSEINSAAEGTISFKVNGSLIKTSGWNIALFFIVGQRGVNVTSNMHEDPRTVTINVNAIKAGTYLFKQGAKTPGTAGIAYGGYRPDFLKKMLDNYRFESGEFTISSIDTIAHTFSGSFFGKVKNNKGQQIDITEGKVITAKLKPTVIPAIR